MRLARTVRKALVAGASVALVLASLEVRGQAQSRGDKVAAEALFEDGRKLVTAGKYADACPKFADSEQLDPSAATLLNLANCWEKVGRTATAWATYREAASLANGAGRNDYVATAQRHADALALRLAHLTLTVAQAAPGIEVQRDGSVIPPAEWGTPIPIDTGSHTLAAAAPGHTPWTSTVDVPTDGAVVVVTVPQLEATVAPVVTPAALPASEPAPNAAMAATPPPASPAVPSSGRDEGGGPPPAGGAQRVSGWVLGSLGVASVAVGAVFAGLAESKYQSSLSDCMPKDSCDPTGLAARNQARSYGDIASWTIGGGAAAIVGGLVLWATAPRRGSVVGASGAALAVAPTAGGAVMIGSW